MNEKELRELALRLQEDAGEILMRGCFTDIWIDDKVHAKYAGCWAISIFVGDLMELCKAVLKDAK